MSRSISLPNIAVRRPVLAAVASLLLVVFGLGALQSLPVRELPDVDLASVTINTTISGTTAKTALRLSALVSTFPLQAISGWQANRDDVAGNIGDAKVDVLILIQPPFALANNPSDPTPATDQTIGAAILIDDEREMGA